jgi:hypothetical protein
MAGAQAFRKDLPPAGVQFLEAAHFAIKTDVVHISSGMKEFLSENGIGPQNGESPDPRCRQQRPDSARISQSLGGKHDDARTRDQRRNARGDTEL